MIVPYHFKIKNMILILEFSEGQQAWHLNYGDKKEETFGYSTIAKDEDDKLGLFIKRMSDEFLSKGIKLAIDTIKEEWLIFNFFLTTNQD